MNILKKLGIEVFLPLLFAFVILLMLVAVPIDATSVSDHSETPDEVVDKDKTTETDQKPAIFISAK